MKYRVYIDANKIEKIDEYDDYEDMIFCLDYLIRVLHWNRRILVIQHNIELDMDEVLYLYSGNIEEYMEWNRLHSKTQEKGDKNEPRESKSTNLGRSTRVR